MLSIAELKLIISKLEELKGTNFQELIDTNLKILKKIAVNVDLTNQAEIDILDKPKDWYKADLEYRKNKKASLFSNLLTQQISSKIKLFSKMGTQAVKYNSLEIGPGNATFARDFLPWRLNYYVDVLSHVKKNILKQFHPAHHKFIKFYTTDKTKCQDIPNNAVNFVFSWDTFTFFTQQHIDQYLSDLFRVAIPGCYFFIHYANCDNQYDLSEAKRGYWNYNTRKAMQDMIIKNNFKVIEFDQFKYGNDYAIFQKPGNQNPVLYKVETIPVEKK